MEALDCPYMKLRSPLYLVKNILIVSDMKASCDGSAKYTSLSAE